MQWDQPLTYAVKHNDEQVVSSSRSGGIFTALSDDVLEQKGLVYGCALTEDFSAMHIRAENKADRDRMRGSKYVQSKLGDTFKQVRNDLEQGKQVLFSGTSCQVAGLKNFLGKEYDKLLCVDILCHGVPSPLVWHEYLKWQEHRHHDKIVGVEFRNKKLFGWREHIETVVFEQRRPIHSRVFTRLFHKLGILRPSCYHCPFKSVLHPGDITIADYWGIEKAAAEFDDNKGVSLVLVNNDKGNIAFQSIKNRVLWKETKLEDSMQTALQKPFAQPDDREQLWDDFHSGGFSKIARKYAGADWKDQIKDELRSIKSSLKMKIGR